VPLCDGSTNLTLRIFHGGQSSRGYLGSGVRVENGHPSFAVDGQCRYFMSGGWVADQQSEDLGWREGVVSDDLRRALEAKTGAEDLREALDCGSGVAIYDVTPLIIANARSSLICVGGSSQPVRDVFAFVRERAQALWPDAQPLEGDVRITVLPAYGGEPPRWYPWSMGLAFEDYFEPSAQIIADNPTGQGRRVAAMDAAPLRMLREQYLRDTRPGVLYLGAGIPITDGQRWQRCSCETRCLTRMSGGSGRYLRSCPETTPPLGLRSRQKTWRFTANPKGSQWCANALRS
jgi:hypothetical protein